MTPTSVPLTIALPTYNGARHLAETLRSILDQSVADPFDLLVSDDRSEDETLTIIRQLAGDRARILINPERLGLAGNWNRCASLATTPLLAIIHQDDRLLPGHLAAHLAAFAQHPRLGMTCGAFQVIDAAGSPISPSVIERPDLGPTDRFFPPGSFVAELAARNPVRCSTVMLRVEALNDVGGFDPAYRYAVDWDCWLRIARCWSVAWLATPSVAVRWHAESETHRFHRGSSDLDEVAQLLDQIHSHDAAVLPHPRNLRRSANRSLSAAYLNRSLDALHAGNAPLASSCLRRSLSLHRPILFRILRDPRLAFQMATLAIAPHWASRQFQRPDKPTDSAGF
ncbi:glycosyltransferase family 2 protein [Tautonia rosea]|uniref:glycosyltransferase family 2 protein n=1 Tax=Tautonia rosea TaxID=2728037 RepID=UPI0014727F4D|nr:glycosyltransferase [Tautonia rosea]